MNEISFKQEMTKAKALQKNSDNPEYWAGYQRGLRRGFHGEKFGTEEEHQSWLSAADDEDETRKQRGLGYRDGLSIAGFKPQVGRPTNTDGEATVSYTIRLTQSTINAIPAPEGKKRQWVQKLIESHVYCTQNNGDCMSCSLVNYGRDCHNNPIEKFI